MQVRKLHEYQGIKPASKPSAEAIIAAIETLFGVNSQPDEGDVMKKVVETPTEPA